jgi:hypothetical protein
MCACFSACGGWQRGWARRSRLSTRVHICTYITVRAGGVPSHAAASSPHTPPLPPTREPPAGPSPFPLPSPPGLCVLRRPNSFSRPMRCGLQVWLRFPHGGSEVTPPHPSTDFKWKDYCPTAFRRLRELFGIDASDYIRSICGDQVRQLVCSQESVQSMRASADSQKCKTHTHIRTHTHTHTGPPRAALPRQERLCLLRLPRRPLLHKDHAQGGGQAAARSHPQVLGPRVQAPRHAAGPFLRHPQGQAGAGPEGGWVPCVCGGGG